MTKKEIQAGGTDLDRDRFADGCRVLPTPMAWKLLDLMNRRALERLEAGETERMEALTDNVFALTRELARRVSS